MEESKFDLIGEKSKDNSNVPDVKQKLEILEEL